MLLTPQPSPFPALSSHPSSTSPLHYFLSSLPLFPPLFPFYISSVFPFPFACSSIQSSTLFPFDVYTHVPFFFLLLLHIIPFLSHSRLMTIPLSTLSCFFASPSSFIPLSFRRSSLPSLYFSPLQFARLPLDPPLYLLLLLTSATLFTHPFPTLSLFPSFYYPACGRLTYSDLGRNHR